MATPSAAARTHLPTSQRRRLVKNKLTSHEEKCARLGQRNEELEGALSRLVEYRISETGLDVATSEFQRSKAAHEVLDTATTLFGAMPRWAARRRVRLR